MDNYLAQLRSHLEILSSKPKNQIEYIHKLGLNNIVDELALEFDDLYILAEQKYKKGILGRELYEKLNQLSEKLTLMSGNQNDHLWYEESLSKYSEWIRVRELASDCLHLIIEN